MGNLLLMIFKVWQLQHVIFDVIMMPSSADCQHPDAWLFCRFLLCTAKSHLQCNVPNKLYVGWWSTAGDRMQDSTLFMLFSFKCVSVGRELVAYFEFFACLAVHQV
jgi:hypothetical protein